MAFSDVLTLLRFALGFVFPAATTRLLQLPGALIHRYTYAAGPSPRNVVIIGGSFAGITLAQRLCEMLPSGWRVVLVERNSHFYFPFVFPRYSVVPGHEHKAFIPYDEILCAGKKGVTEGIFARARDAAAEVVGGPAEVRLESGEVVPFEYLVVATGTSSARPSRLASAEKHEACAELRALQGEIAAADRIAVLGGGAVGVELATNIKDWYPGKSVTIVHSRGSLMHTYPERLSRHVEVEMKKLGVDVRLGQRAKVVPLEKPAGDGAQGLQYEDGTLDVFDLVIPCTGQSPNSGIIGKLLPDSISPDSQRILVQPTLQIQSAEKGADRMFALGDVAETMGPRMGRAAMFQAAVVASNIVAMIQGSPPKHVYEPRVEVEGALHLTLGINAATVYAAKTKDDDALLSFKNLDSEDGGPAKLWRMLGAKYDERALVAA